MCTYQVKIAGDRELRKGEERRRGEKKRRGEERERDWECASGIPEHSVLVDVEKTNLREGNKTT